MTPTHVYLLVTCISMILWDVIAPYLHAPQESAVIRDLSMRFTFIPFTLGILISHWFAPRCNTGPSGWGLAAIPLVCVITGDVLWGTFGDGTTPLWRYPLLWALLGMPFGFWLWSQYSGNSPI